jgi:hypothetical protein
MTRIHALALVAALAAAPVAALAQPSAPSPKTYDMRDDASAWIADPNVHAFYQATVEAFAHGPEHLDRAAYEARSREIFRALALSRGWPPEKMQEHLKAIPGEMVTIVTRDPQALASYDSFVVALFGPQGSAAGR